jgi:hypothetical protein
VAGPTLAQTLTAQSVISGDSTALTAALTSVSVGDVVVVMAQTWDTGTAAGTPSGGSQTFTRQVTAAPGGFAGYATIFTATMAAGVASSFTLTLSAPAASSGHSMTVHRWTGATLAATPATVTATYGGSGSSAPSGSITLAAANSGISWCTNDANSVSPATDAYLSPAPGTPDLLVNGSGGSDGVFRYTHQAAVSAGATTIGMSAPTTQKWVLCGVEIQAAAAATGPLPPALFLRQAVRRAATY